MGYFWGIALILGLGISNSFAHASCVELMQFHPVQPLPVQDRVQTALIQYEIQGGLDSETFLNKVEELIRSAADEGAQLLVLPELISNDLVDLSEQNQSAEKQWVTIAEKETPKLFERIRKLANELNVYISGASSPTLREEKIYNTAIFARPDGSAVFQDKIFLTPFEKRWQWTPGERLNVIQTPWGKTVLLICYDSEFPVISHQLARHEPDLLIVPSMTETLSGFRRVRWSAQARAIEHRAYVLHVGTVGEPHPYWKQYGEGAVFTPSEEGFPGVLAQGNTNELNGIVRAEVSFEQLRVARNSPGIFPARDQNQRETPLQVEEVPAP